MAGTKLISTRLTVCVACGHESRVVASTSEEVISRCYACGDVTRTPHRVQPAWSVESGIRSHLPPPDAALHVTPREAAAPGRVAAG
jgi:uncharacterized Zn finger protein